MDWVRDGGEATGVSEHAIAPSRTGSRIDHIDANEDRCKFSFVACDPRVARITARPIFDGLLREQQHPEIAPRFEAIATHGFGAVPDPIPHFHEAHVCAAEVKSAGARSASRVAA